MSDLISRSKVISVLEQLEEHSLTDKMDISNAIYLLSNQPTAYDIDKVVEELEKRSKEYNSGLRLHGKPEEICTDEAIEIVKQGCAGTGTEVETIRDKAVKWNNNSTKKVPYEFIEFVEGKREIGVSDDVCKWKEIIGFDDVYIKNPHTNVLYINETERKNIYCNTCGKKIKVVE